MQNKDLATTAVLVDETQVIKKLLPKIQNLDELGGVNNTLFQKA